MVVVYLWWPLVVFRFFFSWGEFGSLVCVFYGVFFKPPWTMQGCALRDQQSSIDIIHK